MNIVTFHDYVSVIETNHVPFMVILWLENDRPKSKTVCYDMDEVLYNLNMDRNKGRAYRLMKCEQDEKEMSLHGVKAS